MFIYEYKVDRQRQLDSVELDNAVVKHDTTANLEQTCRELIKYFEMVICLIISYSLPIFLFLLLSTESYTH